MVLNYLVEVEDQIQLTDVAEVVIKDLHKQVNGLQGGQLVVRHINAHREEQPSIPPVDDLVCLELLVQELAGSESRCNCQLASCSAWQGSTADCVWLVHEAADTLRP